VCARVVRPPAATRGLAVDCDLRAGFNPGRRDPPRQYTLKGFDVEIAENIMECRVTRTAALDPELAEQALAPDFPNPLRDCAER